MANFCKITRPISCVECSSSLCVNGTLYSLSFGHLLSGNFNCPQSCIDEQPTDYYRSLKPINQAQVDEAMKTIRKRTQKCSRYSIPTVPFCYNPIM